MNRILFLSILMGMPNAQALESVRYEADPSLPLVTIHWVLREGSANDSRQFEGELNFLGELMLRGTKKHDRTAIDQELDRMGAQLAVETRADAMIFRGTVLSSEWRKFSALLREILLEPSFEELEFKRLKSEITARTLDLLSQDEEVGLLAFERLLFGKHPYGNLIEGSPESLSRLSMDGIQARYKKIFRKDKLFLAGTGDADPIEISRYADEVLNEFPASEKKEILETTIPRSKREVVLIDRPGRTQTQIFFGQVGIQMTDPLYFPFQIANQVVGGSNFSARLMKEIRVKRGWSYGATASFRFGRVPRYWQVHLFPALKNTVPALGLSFSLIEDAVKNGITEDEFREAKESLVNSAAFLDNTPKKRVENIILEETIHLPQGFVRGQRRGYQSVSFNDANQSLRDFLNPSRFSIAIIGDRSLIPGISKEIGVPADEIQVFRYPKFSH